MDNTGNLSEMNEAENTLNPEGEAALEEHASVEEAPQTEEISAKTLAGGETDEHANADELAAMTAAVRTLLEDGWTREELNAFAADETALREMAEGKSIRQAARAFDQRQHAAQRARKKGVPTLRATAAGSERDGSMIEEMSDEEFARFSDAAYQALMQNKRVAF